MPLSQAQELLFGKGIDPSDAHADSDESGRSEKEIDAASAQRDCEMRLALPRLAKLIRTAWQEYHETAEESRDVIIDEVRQDVHAFIWWAARRAAKRSRVRTRAGHYEAKGLFGGAGATELSAAIYDKTLKKYSVTALFDKATTNLPGLIWKIVVSEKSELFRQHVRRERREELVDEERRTGNSNGVWSNIGYSLGFQHEGVEEEAQAMELLNRFLEFMNSRMTSPDLQAVALYLLMNRDVSDSSDKQTFFEGTELDELCKTFGISSMTAYRLKDDALDFIYLFRHSQASGILHEMNGVWQSRREGSDSLIGPEITFLYSDGKLRLTIAEQAILVSVGEFHNGVHAVELEVALPGWKAPALWVVGRAEDENGRDWLQITKPRGAMEHLGFVRKMTMDDYHKVTAAHSSIGSVSE